MEINKYYMPPAAINPDGTPAVEELFEVARTIPLPVHIHDINDAGEELIIRCPTSNIAMDEVYEEGGYVKTDCIAESTFHLETNENSHQLRWVEDK